MATASLMLLISAANAQTICLTTPDPALRPIQVLVTRDAAAAIKAAQSKIAVLQRAPNVDTAQLASLYTLEAQSYGILELDHDARAAAAKGLLLAPREDDPVHVALLIADAENVYDESGLAKAAKSIESARSAQSPDSVPDTCLLITLGLLQMRMNHPELAVASLTQAYRRSDSQGMQDQRVTAAATLAPVVALLGDPDQALVLNQELIDWATTRSATLSLSVSKFWRGKLYTSLGRFAEALEAFTEARTLSLQLDDRQGVAFADLNMCEAQIAQNEFELARALCAGALQEFTSSGSTDAVKDARALLGRIELEEGHAERALAILDDVLDHHGADMYGRRVTSVYQWRARANAALGRDRAAYTDLTEYLKRLKDATDAERQRNAIGQRVKFEMTLKDQELHRVRAEALAARLEASRQALARNLVAMSAALVLVIALASTWLWRRRRETQGARRATEERLAAIGRLTGGVAHEFNNLLTVIQQAAGLLARQVAAAPDAAAAELIQEIRQASDVCAEITTQPLSFARQQSLSRESIALEGFLTAITPALEKVAGPAVRIQMRVDQPSPVVRADRRQLTAALLNLVANARDAIDTRGTVTIRAARDAEQSVRIDVDDDGCGMSADVLSHAVEPFYSTKPVGAGSGLGLSMVDGFVRQSGGSIAITSTPKQGTTVSLRLPRAGAHPRPGTSATLQFTSCWSRTTSSFAGFSHWHCRRTASG